jgi:phospholipase/carboxylesterase
MLKAHDLSAAGLKVRLISDSDSDEADDTFAKGQPGGPLIVLCHGYGAPGRDLVPLARFFGAPQGTRFAFPEAPLSLGSLGFGMDSRAWWHLDIERMQYRMMGGDLRALATEIPEGLVAARQKLTAAIDQLVTSLGVPDGGLILGGFSQGAMLALDVALHSQRKPAGLVLLSGTLIAEPEWQPRMASLAGLPIFMSHGTEDPLLPYPISTELAERLRSAGACVDTCWFPGGHEIPEIVLHQAGKFLQGALAKRSTPG